MATKDSILNKLEEIYKLSRIRGNDTWKKSATQILSSDKGFVKIFNSNVKIKLPDKTTKQIYLKDFNVFKDSSKEKTIKILEPYFEVVTMKSSDNIYYIVCKKKGKSKDEIIISRD